MIVQRLFPGALAGLVATAPMTAVMELMYRWLPRREQYPLPPSEITAELTHRAGIDQAIDSQEHIALTLVNHFAYGAAAGAVYGPLERYLPFAPPLRGMAFGLVVWTVSYLGLMPTLGILRPATEHPAGRNVLMITAHLIWGSVLGVLTTRFQQWGASDD